MPEEGASSRTVTVVIPTHDRYDKLRLLLESMKLKWATQPQTVIIVDDSSNPVDLNFEFQGVIVKHLVLGKRAFISKAKNVGWRQATTEFVYFIDDDNVVSELTLRPLLDEMSRSGSTGGIMPAVLYKSRPDYVWAYATPFLNRRLVLNLVGRNLPRDASLEGRLLKTDALPNASFVRRRALEDVGGFDERLVVNSSLDLAQRLKAKGWGVFACTAAFIYHDVEPPGRFGWWAVHGSIDQDRVRYELRDWFLISRRLHPRARFFRPRYAVEAMRFVLPNALSYFARGQRRRKLAGSLIKGFAEGMMITG